MCVTLPHSLTHPAKVKGWLSYKVVWTCPTRYLQRYNRQHTKCTHTHTYIQTGDIHSCRPAARCHEWYSCVHVWNEYTPQRPWQHQHACSWQLKQRWSPQQTHCKSTVAAASVHKFTTMYTMNKGALPVCRSVPTTCMVGTGYG